MTNVAVIHCSSTGPVHVPTGAAAMAAEKDGAEVRLRRVADYGPQATATPASDIAEAMLEDLEWTDALLLGTPTRFGPPAAPLKSGLQTG